ncbi:glutamate 2,3-aminomutase [Clostridiisalibacter paucivorans]|uniref:glutamate 2,3-aminomutase n=1 Tax=Clostridiisalibacter paucivorans TaxID=408753 RepID=UPI0004798BA9|nr:glutamate 2,3-aminomutase [Clostridiisalibacter paucivorans]
MKEAGKNSKRQISLKRAEELKSRISDYLEVKDKIPKGLDLTLEYEKSKAKILAILQGTEEDWNDYKWQLSNRISDVETLGKIIDLTPEEKKEIEEVGRRYRWAVSPYYASLIDKKDPFDPIRLMSIPTALEIIETEGDKDPMAEEYTNPAGSITRRYPDRLIINVTNECAMYCRHCQRRRNIGQKDMHKTTKAIKESIDYIKKNSEIRDVLITGGDPLTLPDDRIEWILKELKAIEHVEYIRIGTRTLVTMPQRITDNLVNIIKKYHPIYINVHFNHPKEITEEAKVAAEKLANAGVPLGNQAVLLNGINNDKCIMKSLNHELLKIRIRPYYIFHAKHVIGTTHFNTSIDDGIEIIEYLRGYTSGMAIPTYIVNAPKGQGKTPILPQYLLSRGKEDIIIRTWEGKVIKYPNHPTKDIRDIYRKN